MNEIQWQEMEKHRDMKGEGGKAMDIIERGSPGQDIRAIPNSLETH